MSPPPRPKLVISASAPGRPETEGGGILKSKSGSSGSKPSRSSIGMDDTAVKASARAAVATTTPIATAMNGSNTHAGERILSVFARSRTSCRRFSNPESSPNFHLFRSLDILLRIAESNIDLGIETPPIVSASPNPTSDFLLPEMGLVTCGLIDCKKIHESFYLHFSSLSG